MMRSASCRSGKRRVHCRSSSTICAPTSSSVPTGCLMLPKGLKPASRTFGSQRSEVESEVTRHTSHGKWPKVARHTSRGQRTHGTRQGAGQRSEIRGQRSEVRGQRSEASMPTPDGLSTMSSARLRFHVSARAATVLPLPITAGPISVNMPYVEGAPGLKWQSYRPLSIMIEQRSKHPIKYSPNTPGTLNFENNDRRKKIIPNGH